MKQKWKLIIGALLCAGILTNCEAQNKNDDGKRVTVEFAKHIDGDTTRFYIDGEEKKVRYIGIDTPETVKANTPMQPYGKEASDYTEERLTSAKKIQLEYDPGTEQEDKYGRVLAWVWVDDSLLQEELVENGLAKLTYLKEEYKYADELHEAEKEAKEKKLNLWE